MGTKKKEDPINIVIQIGMEQKCITENESKTQTLLRIESGPRKIKVTLAN